MEDSKLIADLDLVRRASRCVRKAGLESSTASRKRISLGRRAPRTGDLFGSARRVSLDQLRVIVDEAEARATQPGAARELTVIIAGYGRR